MISNTVSHCQDLRSRQGVHQFGYLFLHHNINSICKTQRDISAEAALPCLETHVPSGPDSLFSRGSHIKRNLDCAFHHPLSALKSGLLILTLIVL